MQPALRAWDKHINLLISHLNKKKTQNYVGLYRDHEINQCNQAICKVKIFTTPN
jgi:hypothetical protein